MKFLLTNIGHKIKTQWLPRMRIQARFLGLSSLEVHPEGVKKSYSLYMVVSAHLNVSEMGVQSGSLKLQSSRLFVFSSLRPIRRERHLAGGDWKMQRPKLPGFLGREFPLGSCPSLPTPSTWAPALSLEQSHNGGACTLCARVYPPAVTGLGWTHRPITLWKSVQGKGAERSMVNQQLL